MKWNFEISHYCMYREYVDWAIKKNNLFKVWNWNLNTIVLLYIKLSFERISFIKVSKVTHNLDLNNNNNIPCITKSSASTSNMRIKRESPCLVLRFMPINTIGKFNIILLFFFFTLPYSLMKFCYYTILLRI